MPRKKKVKEQNLPEEVSTTMEGKLAQSGPKEKITELEVSNDLTVTREQFNEVVNKLNEVIRKVN